MCAIIFHGIFRVIQEAAGLYLMRGFTTGTSFKLSDPWCLFCNAGIKVTTITRCLGVWHRVTPTFRKFELCLFTFRKDLLLLTRRTPNGIFTLMTKGKGKNSVQRWYCIELLRRHAHSACMPSRESGTSQLLPQELLGILPSQDQTAILLNCVCEHLHFYLN